MTRKLLANVSISVVALCLSQIPAAAGHSNGAQQLANSSSSKPAIQRPVTEPKQIKLRDVKLPKSDKPDISKQKMKQIDLARGDTKRIDNSSPKATAKVDPSLGQKTATKLDPHLGLKTALQTSNTASAFKYARPPLADAKGRLTKSSVEKYVADSRKLGRVETFSPTDGAKHQQALRYATNLIKDPSKGYKVLPYGDVKPKPDQKGDTGTIVIDGHDKTVYVPASAVSGPDKRTIVVNCDHCKVVIVGDTSKGGEDDRKIIVNGSGDKVVVQGDSANGKAGQNGGQVVDNRQLVVEGNGDKIKMGGDTATGGAGANGSVNGQKGGNGGTVVDDRKVVIDGNHDKVAIGKDDVSGGNGGYGGTRGGDGGNAGTVKDDRTVDVNGGHDKVTIGGSSADGGRGGNGGQAGGNGGNGGNITDHRQVNDNGKSTKVSRGGNSTNGGDGGNGGPSF
jgi:hypothetical protein